MATTTTILVGGLPIPYGAALWGYANTSLEGSSKRCTKKHLQLTSKLCAKLIGTIIAQ